MKAVPVLCAKTVVKGNYIWSILQYSESATTKLEWERKKVVKSYFVQILIHYVEQPLM